MMQEVFRQEYKYLIPIAEFLRIRPLLAACMEADPNGGPEGYEVRSLYFDDAYENDVRDVLDGVLNKQKVRLRAYPPEDAVFKLEYKCKTGSDALKHSIQLNRAEAQSLVEGGYDFLLAKEELQAKELFARMKRGGYLPRIILAYRRIAYQQPMSDIRITFDDRIRAGFSPRAFFDSDPAQWPVITPDSGVLEVKYASYLPGYLQKILSRIDLLSGAYSKYTNARLLL